MKLFVFILAISVGIISYAQNCANDITYTSTPPAYTSVNNTIYTNGNVTTQGLLSVEFRAGEWINLKPGFNADEDFWAHIANCYYPAPIPSYAKLKPSLDGGYYNTIDGVLKVELDEEYNDTDLVFNIYNDLYDPQNPSKTHLSMTMPTIGYGDNRLEYDFTCPGSNCLSSGIYILEIINGKNEKRYIRFKI